MADSLMRLDSWSKVQGSPTPLGATWVDSAQAGTSPFIPLKQPPSACSSTGKRFPPSDPQLRSRRRRQQNHSRVAYLGAGLRRSGRILLRFQSGRSVTIHPVAICSIPPKSCLILMRVASFCPRIFRAGPQLHKVPTTAKRRWVFSRRKSSCCRSRQSSRATYA